MVEDREKKKSVHRNIKISSIKFDKGPYIKGSESFINEAVFIGKNVLIKKRKQKKYRNIILDSQLRVQRLRIESKMIKTLLDFNISVPSLYGIDLNEYALIIEKIEGKTVGNIIQNPNIELDIELIFFNYGSIISKLHTMDIIHGDLTPFNFYIDKSNHLYLLDFGLSYYSPEIKDKAMDLFIMLGSLKIYPHLTKNLFDSFLNGYNSSFEHDKVVDFFNSLTNKGRYK